MLRGLLDVDADVWMRQNLPLLFKYFGGKGARDLETRFASAYKTCGPSLRSWSRNNAGPHFPTGGTSGGPGGAPLISFRACFLTTSFQEQIESLERDRAECMALLAEAQKSVKELRGKYEAVLIYVTRPSGASLSKHSVLKSARQGGVVRSLVPARRGPAEKENQLGDSREGSPTRRTAQQAGSCTGRLGKREAALAEETESLLGRMERREKRLRAATVRARQLV